MSDDAKTEQADPTAPRPVDEHGRTLDRWGLPVNGPARTRALAEAGKPDPLVDSAPWAPPPATRGRKPAADDKQD